MNETETAIFRELYLQITLWGKLDKELAQLLAADVLFECKMHGARDAALLCRKVRKHSNFCKLKAFCETYKLYGAGEKIRDNVKVILLSDGIITEQIKRNAMIAANKTEL